MNTTSLIENSDLIGKYFPALSDVQQHQFKAMFDVYERWNAQINVISRKDMEHFYSHHVLHALSIGAFVTLPDGSNLIDIGTGGGFPGIPLAVMFPQVNFTLVDSIGKKIKVVNAVADALGLSNVVGIHSRSEEIKEKFDYVTGRAVKPIPEFYRFTKHLLKPRGQILYLKGGDFAHEIAPFGKAIGVFHLFDKIDLPFFETKKLIKIQTK